MLERYRTRLEPLYCPDNGRPAWEPVRLLGVLILQFVLRVADRQAAEAVQYDLRWRLALHLRAGEAAFDPSLRVTFRERLVNSAEESLAFEAVLDYLVEQGWVPKRSRQRLDSTHVRGLLREMSRLECVRETLRLFLEDVEAEGLLPSAWSGYWERYVEGKINPRAGVKALQAKSVEAGADMLAIWQQAAGCWPIAARNAFVLLQRVFLENYEVDPAGLCQPTRAQPSGAVQNPHEPEAQWSSKSTTKDKAWVGYKAQVAETVKAQPREKGEPTANFLTAMVTQNAPASDKPGMAQTLGEQQQMGLELPDKLYVDGAYVCSEALREAQEQERELRGPAPASPDRGKVFTVEAFDVHVEERYAVCPAGQRSGNCSRLEETSTGDVPAQWHRGDPQRVGARLWSASGPLSRSGQGPAPELLHRRRLQHPAALPPHCLGDRPRRQRCRNGGHARRADMTRPGNRGAARRKHEMKSKSRSGDGRGAPRSTRGLPESLPRQAESGPAEGSGRNRDQGFFSGINI